MLKRVVLILFFGTIVSLSAFASPRFEIADTPTPQDQLHDIFFPYEATIVTPFRLSIPKGSKKVKGRYFRNTRTAFASPRRFRRTRNRTLSNKQHPKVA